MTKRFTRPFLLRTGDRFTNCTQLMMRDYKFYLAFENSFCADYVSEKFWRTMSLTLVPIVMGRYGVRMTLPVLK